MMATDRGARYSTLVQYAYTVCLHTIPIQYMYLLYTCTYLGPSPLYSSIYLSILTHFFTHTQTYFSIHTYIYSRTYSPILIHTQTYSLLHSIVLPHTLSYSLTLLDSAPWTIDTVSTTVL